MDKVKGSAIGAQVGSFLWGAVSSLVLFLLGWGSDFWWVGLPVYSFAIVAVVRSVFLGVRIGDGEVVVASWFRRYHFTEGEVSAVDKTLYFGAGGAGVGWLPFFGAVRMIEMELVTGKRVPLPSTIGRRNSVLRLARRMRAALDLNPR